MKNLKLFCGCYVFLLFYIKYTVSLKYVPPTRQIEVSQNHRYRIGVEDAIDEDITHCNFTSNTGLNCNFEVWPTRSTTPRASPYCSHDGQLFIFENIVTEHGKEGICQITVENVQETGPSTWTLIAKNFDGDVVVNNTFEVIFYYSGNIVAEQVQVVEYASFMNYMALDDKINSCNLEFDDTVIELDLHSAKTSISLPPHYSHTEEAASRVFTLGRGLCGFKYINATYTINHLKWTLSAVDDQGLLYRDSFVTYINAKPSEGSTHVRREVIVGTSYVVACSSSFSHFCSLFNPAGKLVQTENCKFSIATFTMADIGIWKCYVESYDSMESTEYTIELVGKESFNEGVATWVEEIDNDYVDVGCQLINLKTKGQYCKIVTPNRQIFNLRSFTATDRYLSIGTDLEKGVCSMQISKPIQEFEKGLWRCEIGTEDHDPVGSLINVGTTEIPDYPKHLNLITQIDESFTLLCEVPYSSVFCRIYAPNGTEYVPKKATDSHLGKCSLTVNKTTPSDNGTWICSFAQKTGIPDDKIIVEVSIAQYLNHYKVVAVNAEDSAELLCISGLPLEYCRFIDPSGKAYHIHNHENSTSLSYFGRGLAYGDCGIRISNTSKKDSGFWTCVTKIIGDTKHSQLSAKTLVVVTSSTMNGENLKAKEMGIAVANQK